MSPDNPFHGLFDDEPGRQHDEDAPRLGDPPSTRREARRDRDRPPRRSRRGLWALLIAVVVVVAMGAGVVLAFGPQLTRLLAGAPDYNGDGHGSVIVHIQQGDDGSDIAGTLQKADVVKSSETFYGVLLKHSPPPTFYPGAYRLAKQMSSKAALAALLDPANQVSAKVTIPEGTTELTVLKKLAKATGLPLDDFTTAAKDPTAFGVPKTAPSLEGYLFPATYQFDPGVTASQVIQRLVQETFQRLDADGVPEADRHRVLTLASIVQKEAGSNPDDLGKIARVFQNRLDTGMPLQSDATVSYGTGNTQTVWTTDQERENAGNAYNTYAHKGLPPGPISNPGDAAIKAALHPAPGDWLYFVAVDLRTGKTVFSTTFAEHQKAVEQLQEWCREPDNASYCK